MPAIDSYSFGRMMVDGTAYTRDVVIYPDGSVLSPWWRRAGHRLEILDIDAMIRMEPEVIVAGTGANGLMRPSDELRDFLKDKAIKFIALPTGEAIHIFNDKFPEGRTGGCFHLTC